MCPHRVERSSRLFFAICVFVPVCERRRTRTFTHSIMCVHVCILPVLCAFECARWCVRGAPRCVGRATMPSGEEIECEVQYSLGPSSVAAAQQLVH